MLITRRRMLQLSSIAGLGAMLSARADAEPVPTAEFHDGPPREVGRKFNADGSVRRYPGNTIISPVSPGSPLQQALVAARAHLLQGEFSRRLAFLPPSSYHMTIFEGVVDQVRKSGYWPQDLPLDAPLEECHGLFFEKLKSFDLGCDIPFRLRFAADTVSADPRMALKLEPVDDAENRKMRTLRDRLAAILNFRQPRHDSYFFHISQVYLFDWMTAAELADYRRARTECVEMLRTTVPIVEMGAPKFCLFEDMFAFSPLLTLRTAG